MLRQGQEHCPTMTLTQKLMLCAALLGNEASTNLEQLYTIPNLQTLGLPLSLASLTGLVSGPSAVIFLPILGWISDRGNNPHKRKAYVVAFSTALLLAGMALIVFANVMKILRTTPAVFTAESSNDSMQNQTSAAGSQSRGFNTTFSPNDFTFKSYPSGEKYIPTSPDDYLTTSFPLFYQSSTVNQFTKGSESIEKRDELPLEAILGLLGYIVLDVGFDFTNSNVKAWTVASSKRTQHTSLLVIGLLMAASGGMLSAIMGTVDITHILGLSVTTVPSVSIQTSVQGAIVFLLVIVGTSVTILAGRRHFRHTEHRDVASSSLRDNDESRCAERGSTECVKSAVDVKYSATLPETFHEGSADKEPLLSKEESSESSPKDKEDRGVSRTNGQTSNYKSIKLEVSYVTKAPVSSTKCGSCCKFKNKYVWNMSFLCASTYFSIGIMLMYSLMASDFVAKGIYGGDPGAEAGSVEFQNYQSGLHAASLGFMVYYSAYLVVSLANTRLLAKLGYKVEYIAANLLMAFLFVVLSVAPSIEAYYALSIAAGIHRACFYVIPYAVANDIIQEEAERKCQGKAAAVGLAMSVVTASMPLAYTTLYPWIGLLEQMTGMVSISLWLGVVYGTCSALLFAFLKKI